MSKIVAITGGIGSGKSVVSAILRVMGYAVYDCDSRAKELMGSSPEIRASLVAAFGGDAVLENGSVNTKYVASRVFNNAAELALLNSIVHPAVRSEFKSWASGRREEYAFVETAILKESGMDGDVDEAWEVSAPEELRMRRVMTRSGLTREEVESRLRNQSGLGEVSIPVVEVVNDGVHSVLSQISKLVKPRS